MAELKVPAELKYAKSDEWLRIEGDTGTIGISDYAQDQLNDIVYVELPVVGDTFNKGETFGSVESVKAVADLVLPVGGEVIAVNDTVTSASELVNSDPYGKGWLIKIKINDAAEADSLLNADAYSTYRTN